MITYFVTRIGEDPENFENKNNIRTIAGQAIYIFLGNTPEKKWKKEAKNNKHLTDKFSNLYKKLNIGLLKTYRSLTDFRNDINHCGFNKSPKQPKIFANKLEEFISAIENNLK